MKKGIERAYMYLDYIDDNDSDDIIAYLDIDCKNIFGNIKNKIKQIHVGDSLYKVTRGVPEYKTYIVENITSNSVKFENGITIKLGETRER